MTVSHDVRAVVVTTPGDRSVLEVRPWPVPEPGPGQLRVRLAAAGVNFMDVYQRQGIAYTLPTPFVLGKEGAGTVLDTGPDVTGFSPGDAVAWCDAAGSQAEEVLVDVRQAVRVPDGIDLELAAAVMLQGITAQYLVTSTHAVTPGDVALVHAAAGGVGQLLVQLIKHRGGTVIATTSTPEKEALAREAGADEVIRYDQVDDLAAEVRSRNGGRGVGVVYDGVGKDTFDASLGSLAPRGLMVLFGAASGQVPPFDPQRLNSGGSLFLTRPTMGHYLLTREELEWRAGEVLGAVAAGDLRVRIGGRYPIERAADAYADLEGRKSTGKLLIVPQ